MEIDLLKNYPRTPRDTQSRNNEKTEAVRSVARQFGKDFFDGERKYGYGGFKYNPRFWQPVIPDIKSFYKLSADSRVLDVGCAKGFMMYDLECLIPNICTRGVDISSYAVANAKAEIKDKVQLACATDLPFEDASFDLVVSINTVHNLDQKNCAKALQEITRVSKGHSYITVDAYRNEEEKQRMFEWNLTAKTIMHVDEWKEFFSDVGYTGDYYWFIP
ncbi:class I SAM-dependent methyltransferase [Catenovulum sediminis]|uniref:Class I SAM-dependent methyltransferase n=1 Tax=Catenovulum sediminis TaxID=1740262 RepID=A0ABV1RGX4_9ALTE